MCRAGEELSGGGDEQGGQAEFALQCPQRSKVRFNIVDQTAN
jgi:hypothetical protein